MIIRIFILILSAAVIASCDNSVQQRPSPETNIQLSASPNSQAQPEYSELYRPQFHFTPKAMWMNDPNGMVYYDGVYHLFFQQNPTESTWGDIHWGHAVSKDLVHWEQQPPALTPDNLGLIFSGSAVVDANNTSGFGADGKIPLVALYTSHSMEKEQQGATDVENQSLAFSLDNGVTWTKYQNNPVLKNPGTRDFRDPKVSWYEPAKKWIAVLAVGDHVEFYSSPNLKDWTKESEFGKTSGSHGGVWECPDLVELDSNGQKKWVLFVSINPGAPNGGSATQYFVGDFDGKNFQTSETETKWIDYGTDNYAGVTWSNTANRRIFLGWMSNWNYARDVPTSPWRSAMTVPRELSLKMVGSKYFVAAEPVAEMGKLSVNPSVLENLKVAGGYHLSEKVDNSSGRFRLKFTVPQIADWSIILSNSVGEQIIVGYDQASNNYYLDRSKSGKTDFENSFARAAIKAPRIAAQNSMKVDLLVDSASLELFADDGLTALTGIFFPTQTLRSIEIKSSSEIVIPKLEFSHVESIWKK